MAAKYSFYEKVKIHSEIDEDIKNPTGYILGISETSEGKGYYGVSIYGVDEAYCFYEHELESLDEFEVPEEPVGRARVSVDEDDRGELIELEDYEQDKKKD